MEIAENSQRFGYCKLYRSPRLAIGRGESCHQTLGFCHLARNLSFAAGTSYHRYLWFLKQQVATLLKATMANTHMVKRTRLYKKRPGAHHSCWFHAGEVNQPFLASKSIHQRFLEPMTNDWHGWELTKYASASNHLLLNPDVQPMQFWVPFLLLATPFMLPSRWLGFLRQLRRWSRGGASLAERSSWET